MGVGIPWENRNFAQQGFTYEVCIFDRPVYRCSGGGEKVDADARFPPRCWLGEAKHIKNPKQSPFMKEPGFWNWFQKEKIFDDVDDEFRRYGIVTRNPDAISLRPTRRS